MKIVTKYGCPECGSLFDTIYKARDCIAECIQYPDSDEISYCDDCKNIEFECECDDKSEAYKERLFNEAGEHPNQRKLI